MSGLSLMQTRSFIDHLGDLDEEITKVCRAADVVSKSVGKDQSDGVGRLKESCVALQDKQKFVREAKDCLLGLDGFMHALSGEMRQLMDHPQMGGAVSRIAQRMQHPLGAHVTTIVEETVDGLRRVSAAVKALREATEDAKRAGSIKESAKALSKVCTAAENAIRKALQHSSEPVAEPVAPAPQSGDDVVEVAEVVEKAAGNTGYHGYALTAALPPEFLENAQKKKDEAAAKKDEDKEDEKKSAGEMPDFIKKKIEEREDKDEDEDEKGACKKAESLVPGNESIGPKDEGEEDEGWVPGHRTTQKPTDEDSKKATDSDHGYNLTADSKDPDPSMDDDLPGEDTDGEPVVDKSAKGKLPPAFLENIEKMKAKSKNKKDEDGDKDDDKKKAGYHGYELVAASDHGYDLNA